MPALKLDRIDINILAHLQRNGRITNINLAQAVSLSPSPCLLRVKRLEDAGYITSYNAHIDLAKLGETVTVFTEARLSASMMTSSSMKCSAVGAQVGWITKASWPRTFSSISTKISMSAKRRTVAFVIGVSR